MKRETKIFLIMLLIIASICSLAAYTDTKHKEGLYKDALQLIEEEKYAESENALKQLPEGYKDRDVLLYYLSARNAEAIPDKYDFMKKIPESYQGIYFEEIREYRVLVKEDYRLYELEKKRKEEEEEREREERRKKAEEEQIARDAVTYPYYGMREESLNRCALGKPTVELCKDFYKLRISHKSKTYTFGTFRKPNSGRVTVFYRRHLSNRVDDYIDYPITNGYVHSGYYIDADGVRYDFDSEGTDITYPSDYHPHPSTGYLDPYDVDKYDDPEDFYYDYEDDFDDYEDAEDYWDEHHAD